MANKRGGVWPLVGRLVERINVLTGFLGALAIMAAALIVTEGVIVRKVLGLSTVWQIEMSVFLLMYACFVGAGYAQRNHHHLNVDLVIIHLSPKGREIVLLITAVVSCLICGLIAYHAWPMWWESLVNNEHTESLWGPPLWIPYLFLPLGMTLLFLQYLVQIVDQIGQIRSGAYRTEAVRTELKGIEIPAGRGDEEGDDE